MKHELRILPHDYARVKNGTKTFDIRPNDKGFQYGDIIIYKEWSDEKINATSTAVKGFTDSPDLEFKVGFVHVLDSSTVVLSLLHFKNNNKRK